jgi:hypothetical protein
MGEFQPANPNALPDVEGMSDEELATSVKRATAAIAALQREVGRRRHAVTGEDAAKGTMTIDFDDVGFSVEDEQDYQGSDFKLVTVPAPLPLRSSYSADERESA